MSRTTARGFKLTTTLDVSGYTNERQELLTQQIDSAVYEASSNYPTVSRYFVRHIPEASEILIGLQIDKVRAERVENIANALIDESLGAVFNGESSKRPETEESLLVRS